MLAILSVLRSVNGLDRQVKGRKAPLPLNTCEKGLLYVVMCYFLEAPLEN